MFSERLRKTRERMGLTQRELNRRCGFGEHTIYKYESERYIPSTENLKIIAEILNVSTDYLLGLSLEPGGQIGDCDLSDEERDLIDVLRRDGFLAAIRWCTERAARQPNDKS